MSRCNLESVRVCLPGWADVIQRMTEGREEKQPSTATLGLQGRPRYCPPSAEASGQRLFSLLRSCTATHPLISIPSHPIPSPTCSSTWDPSHWANPPLCCFFKSLPQTLGFFNTWTSRRAASGDASVISSTVFQIADHPWIITPSYDSSAA